MRVLYVCTANICRSASAAHLLRSAVAVDPPIGDVEVRSAGTGAVAGAPGCRVAPSLAGHAEQHRSQPLTADLIEWADLILPAARDHREVILRWVPSARTRTFTVRQAGRIARWMLEAGMVDAARDRAALETGTGSGAAGGGQDGGGADGGAGRAAGTAAGNGMAAGGAESGAGVEGGMESGGAHGGASADNGVAADPRAGTSAETAAGAVPDDWRGRFPPGDPRAVVAPLPPAGAARWAWLVSEMDAARGMAPVPREVPARAEPEERGRGRRWFPSRSRAPRDTGDAVPVDTNPDDVPDPHVLGMGLHEVSDRQIREATESLVALLERVDRQPS